MPAYRVKLTAGSMRAVAAGRVVVVDDEVRFHESAALRLAESLSQPTGKNAAFPALESVTLTLKGPLLIRPSPGSAS